MCGPIVPEWVIAGLVSSPVSMLAGSALLAWRFRRFVKKHPSVSTDQDLERFRRWARTNRHLTRLLRVVSAPCYLLAPLALFFLVGEGAALAPAILLGLCLAALAVEHFGGRQLRVEVSPDLRDDLEVVLRSRRYRVPNRRLVLPSGALSVVSDAEVGGELSLEGEPGQGAR